MKFTNAFLGSLLFFGVTPLAIDRKRNEHALTTISSPFATTSSVTLVTPDDAGAGDITDFTHDIHGARAGIGLGGRQRGTTSPSRGEIQNAETITTRKRETKSKPKPKPKPKSKTKPKGKAPVACTGEQKKAGKCPD
jgi:hypothetical protein